MKNITLAARKAPEANNLDRNYGPFYTVRFTHQGIMADNDIVLIYDREKGRWHNPHQSDLLYSHIEIEVRER